MVTWNNIPAIKPQFFFKNLFFCDKRVKIGMNMKQEKQLNNHIYLL